MNTMIVRLPKDVPVGRHFCVVSGYEIKPLCIIHSGCWGVPVWGFNLRTGEFGIKGTVNSLLIVNEIGKGELII